MGEIVIRIQVPDGIIPDVDYVQQPREENFAAQPQDAPQATQAPVAAPQAMQAQGDYIIPQAIYQEAVQAFGADAVTPQCPMHGPMKYYPAGTNPQKGTTFNASHRCVKGCPTPAVWQKGNF